MDSAQFVNDLRRRNLGNAVDAMEVLMYSPSRMLAGFLQGLALLISVPSGGLLHAQTTQSESTLDASRVGALFEELAHMDSAVFDASFVSCDHEKANAIFTHDVEFYHDKTGFQSGRQVHENTKKLTESCPGERGIRRELVAGSLQVFPIKDFGAVQMGVHRFIERGSPTMTVAKFVHLWKKEDGKWRLSRVLSFDHQFKDSGSSSPETE
jgi:hypothetical protein